MNQIKEIAYKVTVNAPLGVFQHMADSEHMCKVVRMFARNVSQEVISAVVAELQAQDRADRAKRYPSHTAHTFAIGAL